MATFTNTMDGNVTIIPASDFRQERGYRYRNSSEGELPINAAYYMDSIPHANHQSRDFARARQSRQSYTGSKSLVSIGTGGGRGYDYDVRSLPSSAPYPKQYRNGYSSGTRAATGLQTIDRDQPIHQYIHSGGQSIAGDQDYRGGAFTGGGRTRVHKSERRVVKSSSGLHQSSNNLAVVPRANYAPTYTTYPPSSIGGYRDDYYNRRWRYPLWLRLILKLFEIAFGLAVIGLVVGPANGEIYHDWVVPINARGQLAVLIMTIICVVLTAGLLLTVGFSKWSRTWCSADMMLTGFLALVYIAIGGLEAWYASCYPSIGRAFPDVCYRTEWIIAAVFAFVALILYIVDTSLSLYSGANFLL